MVVLCSIWESGMSVSVKGKMGVSNNTGEVG